jgi:hypothetical protein
MHKLTRKEMRNVLGGYMAACTVKCGSTTYTCGNASNCESTDGEGCESYNRDPNTNEIIYVEVNLCLES